MALQKRKTQGGNKRVLGFSSEMMLISKPHKVENCIISAWLLRLQDAKERSHLKMLESKKLKKLSCVNIYVWKANLICLDYMLFSCILSGYY